MSWLKAQYVNILMAVVLVLVVVATQIVRGSLRKTDKRLEQIAIETHNSLCAFKFDLSSRYIRGAVYVADVKAGRRKIIEGLTVQELERSVKDQGKTLDALDPLTCIS